jgi:hypothetical protein
VYPRRVSFHALAPRATDADRSAAHPPARKNRPRLTPPPRPQPPTAATPPRATQNVPHLQGSVPQRRGPVRLRELLSGAAQATGPHLQRDLAAHQPARSGASTPASSSQGESLIFVSAPPPSPPAAAAAAAAAALPTASDRFQL